MNTKLIVLCLFVTLASASFLKTQTRQQTREECEAACWADEYGYSRIDYGTCVEMECPPEEVHRNAA